MECDLQEEDLIFYMEEFILRGANIHLKTQRNPNGLLPNLCFTALMVSVSHQNDKAFKELIKLGANLDEKDNRGYALQDILNESFHYQGKKEGGLKIEADLQAYQLQSKLPDSLKKNKHLFL